MGEDATISARVENHHSDAPLEVTGFSGLAFTFDRPPMGLHHAMHPDEFYARHRIIPLVPVNDFSRGACHQSPAGDSGQMMWPDKKRLCGFRLRVMLRP